MKPTQKCQKLHFFEPLEPGSDSEWISIDSYVKMSNFVLTASINGGGFNQMNKLEALLMLLCLLAARHLLNLIFLMLQLSRVKQSYSAS